MQLEGSRAILTGASRGLGVAIAETLAARGVDLVLAARNAAELEAVKQRLAPHGREVVIVPTDVGDRAALERLADEARAALGEIDLIVNNAGIELGGYFEDLSLDDLDAMVRVNLAAPMALTRLLLPDLLARDRGHIVNIASLAGLGPNAFNEPYGATKAGVIGFTRSLRATLKTRKAAVSASVICPGFISDAGMYANANRDYGTTAPGTLGTSTPQDVADAVVRAVEKDVPEIVVNGRPIRPLLALGLMMPRAMEWFAEKLKANDTFKGLAEARRKERRPG